MSNMRGVIFDLDDTLFDCTGQLTQPARVRAAEVLAEYITQTTQQQLTSLQTDLSEKFGSSGAIREIGSRYQLPSSAVEDALSNYNRDDIPKIVPYPDAITSLETILDENKIILLVTTGRRNRQLAKVEQLGLSQFFEPNRNLFVHEPDSDHPTKKAKILQALASARLSPEECISIGDKLDSDVTVGNLIGMTTVRIRKGRQRNWDPSTDEETPDHEIRELIELLGILQL